MTLPDSVTTVGDSAFVGVQNVPSITIPPDVTHIGKRAFQCPVTTAENNPCYTSQDGVLLNKNKTELIGCPVQQSGRYIVPSGVRYIVDGAFEHCRHLTCVVIPESVTQIGHLSFAYCLGLVSVSLPASVTSLAGNAFWGCTSMKKLPAFGCMLDGTQCDFSGIYYWDVEAMLKEKDYTAKVSRTIKFPLVTQIFRKDCQPEAESFIKKNLSKILPYFIRINDCDTVKGLLECGRFVTKRNIAKWIALAIEHTQSSGDFQIQALLLDYCNKQFSPTDPAESLRL